jgi:hypothetical protein
MKENNFSNAMQENMTNHKQSCNTLNLSHNDLLRGYDDDHVRDNINNQINFVS